MNYMTQHLLEAIEINKNRKPLYASLSKKKSLRISRMLMVTERLSLISSYPLDNMAKYWQKRGVPVMKYEFIPMDETPEFSPEFEDDSNLFSTLPAYDTKAVQQEAGRIYSTKDYKKLAEFMDQKIDELKEFPKHYCMVRHILESIRRGANLTEKHIEKAKELKVKSPEGFCRYLLNSQIMIIHSSSLLDKWAFPLQKDGIPIIYQDVPYIPAFPETYE